MKINVNVINEIKVKLQILQGKKSNSNSIKERKEKCVLTSADVIFSCSY